MPPAQLDASILAPPSRDLSEREEAYVREYVSNGGNGTKAAKSAGYSTKAAAGQSSRMLRNPVIQQALMREVVQQMGLAAVPALATVTKLARNAKSEYVRLEAAKDLLNRTGMSVDQRVSSRLDADLTVHLDLGFSSASEPAARRSEPAGHEGGGGSENAGSSPATGPLTRNSAERFSAPPLDLVATTTKDVDLD